MSSTKTVLYVYGTLRPGCFPTVEVPGEIRDLGWFPGAVVLEGHDKFFICERTEIDEDSLSGFDRYEGYDPEHPAHSLYIRTPFRDGWIYQYNRDLTKYPEVPGGDWLAYKQQDSGVNCQLVLK